MILIYRHSTLQFISWKWKHLYLILRERTCLFLERTRKSHHFQGYYHLMLNSISRVFISKFGIYRIVQRRAVNPGLPVWNTPTQRMSVCPVTVSSEFRKGLTVNNLLVQWLRTSVCKQCQPFPHMERDIKMA